MPVTRAEKAARQAILAQLARELRQLPEPGLRVRWGRTLRGVRFLHVRGRGRGRLHVFCISDRGLYALLTSAGETIKTDRSLAEAAAALAAAPGLPGSHHPAGGQAAMEPRPLNGGAGARPGRQSRTGGGAAA